MEFDNFIKNVQPERFTTFVACDNGRLLGACSIAEIAKRGYKYHIRTEYKYSLEMLANGNINGLRDLIRENSDALRNKLWTLTPTDRINYVIVILDKLRYVSIDIVSSMDAFTERVERNQRRKLMLAVDDAFGMVVLIAGRELKLKFPQSYIDDYENRGFFKMRPTFDALKDYTETTPNEQGAIDRPKSDTTEDDKSGDEPQRVIDVNKLKPYFKPTFNGAAKNIDYFSKMIEELGTNRTGKEFAQIALMIYDSDKMNDRRPNTFTEWYVIFCMCIGIKPTKYKKGVLGTPAKALKALFSYL